MVSRDRPYHFKFFKDCLRQILFSPFLNTLTQIILQFFKTQHIFSCHYYEPCDKKSRQFWNFGFHGYTELLKIRHRFQHFKKKKTIKIK